MSYQEYERRGGKCSENCVTDVVKKILRAQREAAGESGYECKTSCENSIEDLLSPSHGHRPRRHTTIPFMLTCKDGCGTFFGSGFTGRSHRSRHEHFHCVESPVFKVRGFVKGSDSCVRLELLTPIYHRGPEPRDGDGDARGGQHHHSCGSGSVCGYFGNRPIDNFRHTGVCITVDLSCFCGISCLDPITPAH